MKLKINEHNFILLKKLSLLSKYNISKDGLDIYIIGNKEIFKSILDDLSTILCNEGFDENSEPNTIGIDIENLIDIISRVAYS